MYFKSIDSKILKIEDTDKLNDYISIKDYFKKLVNITSDFQIYKNNILLINNSKSISFNSQDVFSISPILLGGKGGFGSLLKGQQAVKKKTKNNDACRNLEGKRLRHVNQEQQIKSYQQGIKDEDLILDEYNNPSNIVEIDYSKKNNKSFYKFKENNKSITNSIVKAYASYLSSKRKSDQKDDLIRDDVDNLFFDY